MAYALKGIGKQDWRFNNEICLLNGLYLAHFRCEKGPLIAPICFILICFTKLKSWMAVDTLLFRSFKRKSLITRASQGQSVRFPHVTILGILCGAYGYTKKLSCVATSLAGLPALSANFVRILWNRHFKLNVRLIGGFRGIKATHVLIHEFIRCIKILFSHDACLQI